jgi:HK97 family phage major capsid protein
LRNKSVVMAMGATQLTGLQGNVAIPKHTTIGTVTWLANEASTITETNQVLAQVTLTPKTVGGYTEISRLLLLQSNPSAEAFVSNDLAAIVATAVDVAALNGSGASGQPLGIIGTAGIGGVTGTSIAYAGIVEFQTDVAGGNALTAGCGYVATPVVAGLLKQRVKFTSTASPIWEGQLLEGMVDGYKGMATLNLPTGDLLFGDFGQIVIGSWGVLELEVNPYANFQAGIVGVRAIYTVDIGVRYPSAFSLATAVT